VNKTYSRDYQYKLLNRMIANANGLQAWAEQHGTPTQRAAAAQLVQDLLKAWRGIIGGPTV